MGRILVVDDHDSIRRGLVRALANTGHDVEEAANGTVAIERLHDSPFDVVLTDLRIGGAGGMDVLRTARSIQPDAAVILMTGLDSTHTTLEATRIGFFDLVRKPFDIKEAAMKIEKAIELRRLKSQVDHLRKDEIAALADYFANRLAEELKKRIDGINPDALKALLRQSWPSTLREFESLVERAARPAAVSTTSVAGLQTGDQALAAAATNPAAVVTIPATGISLEEIERQAVLEALRMSKWVQKDAAELLGISPRVINYKIKILGIEIPRNRRVPAEDVPRIDNPRPASEFARHSSPMRPSRGWAHR